MYFFFNLFNFLIFWPCGMRYLGSPTRDEPVPPAVEAGSLNHWTTREFPKYVFKSQYYSLYLWDSLEPEVISALHELTESVNPLNL